MKEGSRINIKFILIVIALLFIAHWSIDYPRTKREYLEKEEPFSLGVYAKDDLADFWGRVKDPFSFFRKDVDYDKVRMTELNNLKGVIELYFNEEGYYPKDLKELQDKKYLVVLPRDPETGKYYYYEYFEDEYGVGYVLEAILSNGEPYTIEK